MEDEKLQTNDFDKQIESEEDEKRRPPLILLILLTTVAVLIALGFSFSAISYLESNETINTIISTIKGKDDKDSYIITYAENIGPYKGGINLINQFPTPDSKGKLFEGENYVYNFALIVGKKTAGSYYELTAIPDSNNTLKPDYVKLYLEKNGKGVPMSYRKNGKVKVFSEYKSSEYKEVDGKLIYSSFITEEDVKAGKIDFVMRMWVSEDAMVDNNFSNKTFAVKVNTYAVGKKK